MKRILIALAVLGLTSCNRAPSGPDAPILYSIAGVKFLVVNRDSRVYPAKYVNDNDKLAAVRRVHSFALCVSLPDFLPQGNALYLRACRNLQNEPGEVAVLSVHARDLGDPPPAPGATLAEHGGLALQLSFRSTKMKAYAPPGQQAETLGYEARPDEHGLHKLVPTRGIDPATEVLFWDGPDADHVTTFIGCTVMLPEQQEKSAQSGACKQEILLPSGPFGGYTVDVTIYYSHHWLPQWKKIEADARKFVERMRADGAEY